MSPRRIALLLTVLAALTVSCAKAQRAAPGPAAAPQAVGEAGDAAANRKLVLTANLAIETNDPAEARARAEALTTAHGGFVERVEARDGGRSQSSVLVLRVPAEQMNAVLTELRALAGEVRSETREVRDVTDQSIDIEARLVAQKATERELLALLEESRGRASGVDEIMAVYRELTQIRTRIESIEGQKKALDGLVSYATIELQIRTDQAAGLLGLAFRPLEFAGKCFEILLALLEFLGYALIFLLVVVAPIVVLALLSLRLFHRLRGRSKYLTSPPVPPAA